MKDIFEDMPFNNPGETLSMAEYEELRLLLTSAKAAFAHEDGDITPDPQIHKNLRAMVAAKKKSRFQLPAIHIDFQRLFTFQVPAYKFAVSMVVLLAIAFTAGRTLSVKNPVVVYKTDTVYKKDPLLADSQANHEGTPVMKGSFMADSMDIGADNGEDNSLTPEQVDHVYHMNHPYGEHPVVDPQHMERPDGRAPAEKSSSRGLMEDSSKWLRNMRGIS